MSSLVFGRSDWGIFLSSFACLWHDVVCRYVKDDADFEGLSTFLSTEAFRERARLSKDEAGHSICPVNLVQDFFERKNMRYLAANTITIEDRANQGCNVANIDR